jgi:hypothetical protein
MYLVFIKSYRDNTVGVQNLREDAKVFSDLHNAKSYEDDLSSKCSGWEQAVIIEVKEG